MFYQLMFFGLCTVPAIILSTAGSPLAEDFPKCHPGGLGYDGKFPVPEIEVTDHHTSMILYLIVKRVSQMTPNSDFQDLTLMRVPLSELSQSESWKATKG
ncbi:hypothetical protein PGT21_037296 [Puccinia graminis f. sp. tritici]|uniref:Uncharacterized protein n=1 Tax=Puccinia graminis f. sp. tritici TaxID=56615 RepID=A0A5B0R3W8_PUCGR|nr:hypothetical protein PGT21_037296 [Puccinia graminis f. sp. tritici]